MNITIFISLLFLLQITYWFVGRRAGKKNQNNKDYFLAGKSVKLFPLMMTFLATQVGGGIVLGSAEEAYLFGWPVLLYPLGAALGLIFLGMGIGRKLSAFQVSTVAQIFEVVYRSIFLKKVASLFSILSLFMILVAQIIASHKFLVGIGLNNTLIFIIFWAIVMVYTAQGGLKAVISTDIVQASFFACIFLAVFAFVLCSDFSIFSLPLEIGSSSKFSSKLFGWLMMPLLFMVIEQDMGQRCFAGASSRIVSRSALIAGIGTMVICIVPVFFGCLAKSHGVEVPKGASVLMVMIAHTTNPFITALVGCAVLAAIISTATSLINAISSNLSNDFTSKELSLRKVRGITSCISLAAIIFAFYFDNIVDLLIQSYELSVSCLFIPIVFALFKKRGNFFSALFSIFLGIIGFLYFRFYPIPFPKEIAALILSLVGYGLGEVVEWLNIKGKNYRTY